MSLPTMTIQPSHALLTVACSMLLLSTVNAEDGIRFNRDILPILSENCYFCHGPDAAHREADLRLDLASEVIPRLIKPGEPQSSVVFQRMMESDADLRMPPPTSHRTLTEKQLELIRKWIEQGANYEEHWAYVPPTRPEVPSTPGTWIRHNAIDAFVVARLSEKGLQQSEESDRHRLIRKVYIDLTGLPPTPEILQEYLNDRSEDWYARLVEALLASPRYGERIVWDWLEAARYADTNGYQGDPTRAMWYWRDWAVQALNENMPFDEFTRKQIAGDLLPNATRNDRIATGFHRNHMINGEGGRIAEESRIEYVQDRVETTGTVWLGLTLTCCRCHDHKYDPISQREYYQLAAYFNSIDESGGNDAGGLANPILEMPSEDQALSLTQMQMEESRLKAELSELEQHLKKEFDSVTQSNDQLPAADPPKPPADWKSYLENNPAWKELTSKRQDLQQKRESLDRSIPRTMVMRERNQPRETFILQKGAYNAPGEQVSHGLPKFLMANQQNAAQPSRLGLAEWLLDANHPLTARVTVNRLWQTFFGVGIVKSPDNFGLQGDQPSHPELLDWLAVEFRDSGWNLKHMVRLMVTSHTYRQSGRSTETQLASDPENRLWSHGPRYRWPSWILRDQALTVSGLLVENQGGPPVNSYQPAGVWEEATFGQIKYQQDSGASLYRRSLYLFWRRIVGPTIFFDNGNRQTCSVAATRTNTPLHSLITLNDTIYAEAAKHLASRVLAERDVLDDASRIQRMFQLCTCRPLERNELTLIQKKFAILKDQYSVDKESAKQVVEIGETPASFNRPESEVAAWIALAATFLNLDETLSKE